MLYEVITYLPQDFGFLPHLTGEQMLAYLLDLKGVTASGRGRRELVADLLERVNLTFAARRKVKDYSGGMRQRLGIAQAVAGDPRIIIVDEPVITSYSIHYTKLYEISASASECMSKAAYMTPLK